jgi:glycolate oxidase
MAVISVDPLNRLRKVIGDSLILKEIDKIPFIKDASFFHGSIPLAVAIPKNTSELQEIMKICYEEGIPVVGRGGGTALTGSSVPSSDSIVISLSRMNKITEISREDRYVIAEAGVRLDDLNQKLSTLNFIYPPDPGSSIAATVGGSIATNAGGLRGAMYGATKEWILGLEVVLPDGTIIQTGGKVLKRSIGYDLTSLFVGSEGTLGLITKAILKIAPKPEKIGRIIAYYESIDKASSAIGLLKANGITPLMAEFMDRIAMDSLTNTKNIKFPDKAKFLLMVDISSTVESIGRHMAKALEIIRKTGASEVTDTTDSDEMAKMYSLRKGLYAAELGERASSDEYIIIGDIVVPPSRLPSALSRIEEESRREKIKASLFGHIGDGNIHANVFYNSNDKNSLKGAQDFLMTIGNIAIENGGSVSAEHGIGLEKKELLLEEMKYKNSLKNIDLMKEIKRVFDPKNIMNRGKIF